MLLGLLLYGFALILFIYIVFNIVRTKKFKTGDAIASLGIIVSILLALRINPPIILSTQSSSQPNPTLVPISQLLGSDEVIYSDEFDSPSLLGWTDSNANADISNGVLKIKGYSSYWASMWRNGTKLVDGQGVLILFKFSVNSVFEIYLQVGNYGVPDMLRWGVTVHEAKYLEPEMLRGNQNLSENWTSTNFTPQSDHWYYLLLKVDGRNGFITRIWDRDDPRQQLEIRREISSVWKGKEWFCGIGVYDGLLEIDSYQELTITP